MSWNGRVGGDISYNESLITRCEIMIGVSHVSLSVTSSRSRGNHIFNSEVGSEGSEGMIQGSDMARAYGIHAAKRLVGMIEP